MQDHRPALRAARHGEAAGDVELLTPERERTGIGSGQESPAVLVGDDVVDVPRIPQGPNRIQCLLGPHIPVGRIEEAAAPEVLSGEGVEGGDHVPGGASAGEVIEGGELAGQFVGLVERGVDGAREAEVLGDRGDSGQHAESVGTADDVLVEDLARALTQDETLGEEEEVELAAFGRARGVFERAEIDLAARLGMPPGCVVVHAAEVGAEDDLLTGCTHR